jgi:hypothetical protein
MSLQAVATGRRARMTVASGDAIARLADVLGSWLRVVGVHLVRERHPI